MNLKRTVACLAQQSFLLYRLSCIYTLMDENVCRKYRKMAEMLHAALHFAVKSIKV